MGGLPLKNAPTLTLAVTPQVIGDCNNRSSLLSWITNKARFAPVFDKQQKAALRALGRKAMALDQFSNIATMETTESAAGTVTFSSLNTGAGFGTKRGLLIEKIQYFFGMSSLNLILDESDSIIAGLTISQGVLDLGAFGDRRIIDNFNIGQANSGTPASAQMIYMPQSHELGAGLPLAETTMYLGILGTSLASVVTVRVRIFFRYIDLTPSDILEIAQNFQLVG